MPSIYSYSFAEEILKKLSAVRLDDNEARKATIDNIYVNQVGLDFILHELPELLKEKFDVTLKLKFKYRKKLHFFQRQRPEYFPISVTAILEGAQQQDLCDCLVAYVKDIVNLIMESKGKLALTQIFKSVDQSYKAIAKKWELEQYTVDRDKQNKHPASLPLPNNINPFNFVPPEITSHIFSFLSDDPKSIASVAQTCKSFNLTTNHDSTWEPLLPKKYINNAGKLPPKKIYNNLKESWARSPEHGWKKGARSSTVDYQSISPLDPFHDITIGYKHNDFYLNLTFRSHVEEAFINKIVNFLENQPNSQSSVSSLFPSIYTQPKKEPQQLPWCVHIGNNGLQFLQAIEPIICPFVFADINKSVKQLTEKTIEEWVSINVNQTFAEKLSL